MIYVSSSGFRGERIGPVLREMVAAGIDHIELSGGTEAYPGLLDDLKSAIDEGVKLRLHNYFPPPPESFVLNLATENEEDHRLSLNHVLDSIRLSAELGIPRFGFHAGFFMRMRLEEMGNQIENRPLASRAESIERFCQSYLTIAEEAKRQGVKIYVENNVYSAANHDVYGSEKPFMLLDRADYHELQELIDFNLLLDVAHLKVSAKTLGLNFEAELAYLAGETDYVHLSDNDGLSDSNEAVTPDSELAGILAHTNLGDKSLTLEVYKDLDSILACRSFVSQMVAPSA